MGELALDAADRDEQYGLLGVRYNALRALYECVRETVNAGEAPTDCLVAQ